MMLMWCMGLALAGEPDALERAVRAELDRSMSELKLPDQAGPYEAEITVVEGQSVVSRARFGQVTERVVVPVRRARVEVRVGDLSVDSSNFSGLFGVPDGVEQRILPTDPVEAAIRRELWLALDRAYKGASQQLAGKLAAREGQQP